MEHLLRRCVGKKFAHAMDLEDLGVQVFERGQACCCNCVGAARAIIEHLYRWKDRVGWSWPTMAKNTAQTAAALRLLPIYKHVTHGLIMQQDVMWQQATEALMKQARSHHTVRTPLAMTPQIFSSTLTAEANVERQVVLLLMWYTSGKVGDILQLHHEDVVRQHDGTLTITFQRGKAVKFRGAQMCY
jgi:hypothetical protein